MKRKVFICLLCFFALAYISSAKIIEVPEVDARMSLTIVAGQPPAAAGCDYDFPALDTDSQITQDINYRIWVDANTLSCSGDEIRVTFEAHSSNTSNIDGVSICQWDDAEIKSYCTAAPIRITWDTGNSATTISGGGTKASDWVDVSGLPGSQFTYTEEYLINIWTDYTGSGDNLNYRRRDTDWSADNVAYALSSTDYTLTQNMGVTGYSIARPYLIKIECR